MKTKVVYALSSDKTDLYLEQLVISLYTLRLYNVSSFVVLVVDSITDKLLQEDRKIARTLVDDYIIVNTPDGLDKKSRSRYIKTTIRSNVRGRYLFIDTDTLVTSDLSFVDDIRGDILAVLDRHIGLFDNQMFFSILNQASKIGWNITPKDVNFFNSGVMLVEDNDASRILYSKWHENWKMNYERGLNIDQPALAIANRDLGYIIDRLPDTMNCQVLGNGLQYLHDAKIIHYFNSNTRTKLKNYPYKLTKTEIFLKVRENGYIIDNNIASVISSPKSLFCNKYEILSDEALTSYYLPAVQLQLYLYSFHPFLFKICNIMAKYIFKLAELPKLVHKL